MIMWSAAVFASLEYGLHTYLQKAISDKLQCEQGLIPKMGGEKTAIQIVTILIKVSN